MENSEQGFDRANGQGQNHDTEGNVANAGNDTLKQNTEDQDKQQEVPTVTPDNDGEGGQLQQENSSNKGQGPSGENL